MTPLNRIAARLIPGAVALVLMLLVAGCWCKPCPPNPRTLVNGGELGVTVKLSPGQNNADPVEANLSKTGGVDHVRWVNETSDKRTLHFAIWPFMDLCDPPCTLLGPGDIVVPARETSHWYTMSPTATVRTYAYHIDPPLKDTGPPTEPAINEKP